MTPLWRPPLSRTPQMKPEQTPGKARRPRGLGIFGKVFLYTTLILVLVIVVAALFFTRQISDALVVSQQQQLSSIFGPLQQTLEGKTGEQAAAAAKDFHDKNAFFEFCVRSPSGRMLYATPDYTPTDIGPAALTPLGPNAIQGPSIQGVTPLEGGLQIDNNFQMTMRTSDGLIISISTSQLGMGAYETVVQKTILAAIILLLVGGFCAFLFARSMAKPIKSLAQDTAKMASLELVPAPISRSDEIGSMAKDVYGMYERLKQTIRDLEAEIKKQQEMEENQRDFFIAASHELKTPVAATSALLEGMIEGVISPQEHPESLRTCLKLAHQQADLISEVLELVRVDDQSLQLTIEQVDLGSLVDSVLTRYQALSQMHGLTVAADIPEDTIIRADRTLITRALSNVLSNALQNTPDDGTVQISCQQQTDTDTLRLSILNQGTPLPPDMMTKLFEPFYRQDKSRGSDKPRGLGLALVAKSLNQMDIPFSLENTPQGILFWMDLPK